MPGRVILAKRKPRRENCPVSRKLKNIGIVSFLTVVSRVLGVVRDEVQVAIMGGSVFIDAFVTAFTLPNLFRRLLGEGSLTAAFVPTLQEELHEAGRAGAFRLLNKVASWLLLVTSGLAATAMLLFSHSRVISWIDPKWYLAADLTVIMFPYLALICLTAAFNATLNVLEHFTEPALSPIWLNLSMIVSLAWAGRHFAKTPLGEVHWLCAGVLVGGFFQLAVPAAALMRAGWSPRLDLELAPRVRQIAALMAPGVLGTAIYQINITVSRLLAFSLPVSIATEMFFANRFMELPIGVFAIAVSTVVYPLIARHAVERNFASMARDFHKGLRLIIVINIPAAAGLALLSQPIVRLIYQHGHFTAANAEAMGVLLAFFVIGLPFFSVVNLMVRAFYAVKDTATPVRVALIDFVVNLGLSLVLKHWLGAVGLVLASTTAIIVQTVLLQRALIRKLPEMKFASLWPSLSKILAATLAMSAVVWFGWRLVSPLNTELHLARLHLRVADLAAVLGLIPLGVAVYGAILWTLRIDGREKLAAMLVQILRRKKPSSSEAAR